MAFLIIGKTATDQLNASALAFLAHDDFEDVVAAQLSGGSSATRAKLAIRAIYYLVAAAAGLYLLFMIFQLPRDSSSAPDGGERSKRRGGNGDGGGEGGGGDGGGGGMLRTWWQGLRRKHGPMAAWNMMLWGTLLAYTATGVLLMLDPGGVTSGVLTLLALLFFIGAQPPHRQLKVQMETFPLQYDPSRSSSIIYWQTVGAIVVSGVLAGAKTGIVQGIGYEESAAPDADVCADTSESSIGQERSEVGVGVFVTAGLMLGTALYYSLVDPHLGAGSSAGILLRDTYALADRRAEFRRPAPRSIKRTAV